MHRSPKGTQCRLTVRSGDVRRTPKTLALLLTASLLSGVAAYTTGDYAAVFGWDGDRSAALAKPSGAFTVRDGGNKTVSFSIFSNPPSYKWYNHSGYLPCLVTEFVRNNCNVKIMNFGDKVTIGGNDFVVAYSRVSITNNGTQQVTLSPGASTTIALTTPSNDVGPGQTVNHDFAVALDRFGASYAFPSEAALKAAGGWDDHFSHMRQFWDAKLAEIAQITTPDQQLNNAYRAGFIYTHIVKDGHTTNVGENGYDQMWDHDATGILASLLTIGYFSEAKDLLKLLPTGGTYADATWKYNWPWALYLLKTGDIAFAQQYWNTMNSTGRKIGADRTGPGGIMKMTNDIDGTGYWTIDNYAALFGLLCYAYNCERLGKATEKQWAENEYGVLLAAANAAMSKTVSNNRITYLPVSILNPNGAGEPDEMDANWAAAFFFGRWAWDGWLAGGLQNGPLLELVDPTYDYGFALCKQAGLPAHTYGGYPGYSTGYNAGYGAAGMRGDKYRTEAIRNYQFMVSNTQSGPFSWWESCGGPGPSAWEGMHPWGDGSCPHIWGQSAATKVLVESVVAEFYDGRVLVGRGVPTEWLEQGFSADNFPISGNKRMGITAKATAKRQVRLDINGAQPAGNIIFDLPIFANNIASATAGTIDAAKGTVILDPSVRTVTVTTTNDLPVPATNTRTAALVNKPGAHFSVRNNRLYLNFPQTGPLNRSSAHLYTVQGKLVESISLTDDKVAHGISLEGRAAGTYIVKLRHANGMAGETTTLRAR